MIAAVENVHKRLGKVQALRGVSLDVREGELLALLGPNGAGKTTLVSLLAGLRAPDRGEVRLAGGDPRQAATRRVLGLTPQATGFPPTLRVREVVELVRAHYPHPQPTDALLDRFGLGELAARNVQALSGGQARRLAVALAFAGNPRLAVLDEPTTGLDVESRRALWREIERFKQEGGTVLLTTHYLEEAEALADRVAVMNRGRVVSEGSPEAIKRRVGLKRVRFRAAERPELAGVERYEREGDLHTFWTADADALVRRIVEQGVAFAELEVLPISLEEAFLAVLDGEVQA
ncbi:ATP-binding cassette domain-containing protein [Deinococcota bacterium DY0809b]